MEEREKEQQLQIEQLEQMRTNTHFNARSLHINKWFVRDPFFLLVSALSGGGRRSVVCVSLS